MRSIEPRAGAAGVVPFSFAFDAPFPVVRRFFTRPPLRLGEEAAEASFAFFERAVGVAAIKALSASGGPAPFSALVVLIDNARLITLRSMESLS